MYLRALLAVKTNKIGMGARTGTCDDTLTPRREALRRFPMGTLKFKFRIKIGCGTLGHAPS